MHVSMLRLGQLSQGIIRHNAQISQSVGKKVFMTFF
uniref:Uncharacterized protein n=1 Tax=Arundo donax TaxID=35708 RepID=A0A0A9H6X5_ARUDO